jgi:hypothetical protein
LKVLKPISSHVRDPGGFQRIDRGEQRKLRRLRHDEIGVAFEHLDGRNQQGRRHLACSETREGARLEVVDIVSKRRVDRLDQESPTAFAGLAARTR